MHEGAGRAGGGPDRARDLGFSRRGESSGRQGDLSAERGWNIGYDSDRVAHEARPSFRGRGPKNYQRSDERIREEVCERLTMDHDVDATEIDVQVSSGVVTLDGTVSERRAKRIAEDLAERVYGVSDVQNNLRVTR